jgi:hypothetical protein
VPRRACIKGQGGARLAALGYSWIKMLASSHARRRAFVTLLYVFGLAFFGASVERYWQWTRAAEAVSAGRVKTVDRWKAYCVVNPTVKSCRPVSPGQGSARAAYSDSSTIPNTAAHGQ